MQINKRAIANVFYTTILGLCSMNLDAAPITGIVNLVASAGVSATLIDFRTDTATGCGNVANPGVPGCFQVAFPSTGNFSSIPVSYFLSNSIKDLPIGQILPLLSFMEFQNGITFDLTKINAGGATACTAANSGLPNTTCTPFLGAGVLSPFILTNDSSATSSTVSFSVEVLGYQGVSSTGTTPYLGIFSTQTAGQNIAQNLAIIGGGGTIVNAYSANFSPVPEPGTLGTLGLGLGMLVFGAYRRSSRSAR